MAIILYNMLYVEYVMHNVKCILPCNIPHAISDINVLYITIHIV